MRRCVTIHLCDLPEGFTSANRCEDGPPIPSSWSCSQWGLPSHSGRPECWCALTAPFHPYLLPQAAHRRFVFCGTVLRVSPTADLPRRTEGNRQHCVLWSPDFPRAKRRETPRPRSPGQLTRRGSYSAKGWGRAGSQLVLAWRCMRSANRAPLAPQKPARMAETT